MDLHRGLLKEKKSKKPKKSKSETLTFNQSTMHTDLVPDQLDWRDYGIETNFLGNFCRLQAHVFAFLSIFITISIRIFVRN